MKKIVIIGGDPNSVNSELIYKVWKNSKKKIRNKIYLVSNYKLLTQQFRRLKFPIKLTKINEFATYYCNKHKSHKNKKVELVKYLKRCMHHKKLQRFRYYSFYILWGERNLSMFCIKVICDFLCIGAFIK